MTDSKFVGPQPGTAAPQYTTCKHCGGQKTYRQHVLVDPLNYHWEERLITCALCNGMGVTEKPYIDPRIAIYM